MSPEVIVVPTGVANVASVVAGVRRAGGRPRCSDVPGEVEQASHVVLPGVGTFAAAMERLGQSGLGDVLGERIRAGRRTLAICLGLQVLCGESEESPGVRGLGVVEGALRRFPETVRVPQLGWNRIEPGAGCRLLEGGHVYFANSYRLERAPDGWEFALADHGGRFVAAIERGGVLACQFHPELSGPLGARLLRRWIEAEVPCSVSA